MVEFQDLLIQQTNGQFKLIKDEMGNNSWMLRSWAVVFANTIAARYLLHLWHDGQVVIIQTEHPPSSNIPDDDIRELKKWCDNNGWSKLCVHNDMINDMDVFEFWFRLYRAGIVYNSKFAKVEEEELKRFAVVAKMSKEDDDNV